MRIFRDFDEFPKQDFTSRVAILSRCSILSVASLSVSRAILSRRFILTLCVATVLTKSNTVFHFMRCNLVASLPSQRCLTLRVVGNLVGRVRLRRHDRCRDQEHRSTEAAHLVAAARRAERGRGRGRRRAHVKNLYFGGIS